MSSYQLNRRIEELEQKSFAREVDISIEAWLKSVSEQKKECEKQNMTIAPIHWEATNE